MLSGPALVKPMLCHMGSIQPRRSIILHEALPGQTHNGVHSSVVPPTGGKISLQ